MGLFFKQKKGNPLEEEIILIDQALETKAFQLAINSGIDLIATLLAKCQFKFYKNKRIIEENDWYLFNVQPNINENASEFWKRAYIKALSEEGCLIIMLYNQLFIADSWNKKSNYIYENYYTDIRIGDKQIYSTYLEKDVLFLDLKNKEINHLMLQLYESYGRLLNLTVKSLSRRKASKWIFRVDTTGGIQNSVNQLKQPEENPEIKKDDEKTIIRKFIESDEAAVAKLTRGKTLEDKSSSVTSDTRDARNLLNDIFDIVCIGMHIPKKIFYGEGYDETTIESLMTTTLQFMFEIIEDEINRKMFGKDILAGNKCVIAKNNIRYVDVINSASKLETLFRISFSFNDILKYLHEEPIDEEWANKRYVTKNYQSLDEVKGKEKE